MTNKIHSLGVLAWGIAVSLACPAGAQQAAVSQERDTAVLTTSSASVDFKAARPMPLPVFPGYTGVKAQQDVAKSFNVPPGVPAVGPGFEPGNVGTGQKEEINLGTVSSPTEDTPNTNFEFGTRNLPFTTARADLSPTATNEAYPYRASGKLFFLVGADTYVCSASLIQKGLVVTAAHCVAEFGKKTYFSGWQFVPGYRNGVAPFGTWTIAQARVLDAYYQGTDKCAQPGVVCEDDVAVLVLNSKKASDGKPYYAGMNTGWYSFGWDRAGFTGQGVTHLTQIGYPNCLDSGGFMQRNDAQGVISADSSSNTIIGSLMCGGSSGGPMVVNFGVRPALTGTASGASAQPNMVIGVNSWGSTNDAVKYMGASPFRSSNIKVLVDGACKAYPDAC
ncbi:trypsin-like serine protease [Bradyrhizobium sp. CB82]|uniref:trypsin-like serine peptidase n=1 Tax=Bradyrhizobium sp. CB82 TaxID=3039159 RepID=UPI0024B25CCE|nr:trypsin-like serine protease [Bradyrhizobium sp. CB82]WFU41817.1 trypsin-like serine protease [Bradyrhizobium sp. CB82]